MSLWQGSEDKESVKMLRSEVVLIKSSSFINWLTKTSNQGKNYNESFEIVVSSSTFRI
jgi:hypothetical protein